VEEARLDHERLGRRPRPGLEGVELVELVAAVVHL
jgi:hypothetical protein